MLGMAPQNLMSRAEHSQLKDMVACLQDVCHSMSHRNTFQASTIAKFESRAVWQPGEAAPFHARCSAADSLAVPAEATFLSLRAAMT